MRKSLFAALIALAPLCAHAQPALVAQWMQLGPGGTLEARAAVTPAMRDIETSDGKASALVTFAGCPDVAIDGVVTRMATRALTSDAFPQVCTATVPPGSKSVAIGGDALPLPVAAPTRIAVFGDTGCRINGTVVQDCGDPEKWPFAMIAAEAAAQKPDLVIHVGDYLYRESACPAGNAGCAGTPFGDNWPTWEADFFAPAKPLLAAAPWIFVRGNHEECWRAGPGWLRLLGPFAYVAAAPCAPHLAPYSVPAGALNLVVMDDVDAPDASVAAAAVPVYRTELAALADAKAPAWLLLHRPIWGAISGPLGLPVGGNATLIAAVGNSGIPAPVELMLAGHIHSFEAMNYGRKPRVPPQIVAGFGGDRLDPTPARLKGTLFQGHSGVTVKDGISLPGFGFLMIIKSGAGWTVEIHDTHGQIERRCLFHAGRVDCPRPR